MGNAKVILINAQGEILLLHRDRNAPEMPNTWSFVGGGVEPGEAPERAIVRETIEEIGFDLVDFFHFKTYHDRGVKRHVFVGRIDKLVEELVLTEGDDLGFFQVSDAMDMDLSPNTRMYIQDYFLGG